MYKEYTMDQLAFHHRRCRLWQRRKLCLSRESEEQRALVKYNTYHKENTKAWKQDISKFENWLYNEKEDTWTCAGGQKLLFRYESRNTTESGYEIVTRNYRSISCEGLSILRMHEPESVFGQIKNNRGFRRFLLRGLPIVSLKVGWLSLAHNLLKKAARAKIAL